MAILELEERSQSGAVPTTLWTETFAGDDRRGH
jgi:hypothetical protein